MPSLRIATWNVWFDPLERVRRADALLELLANERPDVVALQEVTPEFWAVALKHPLFADMNLSCGVTPPSHGVVMGAKEPMMFSDTLLDSPLSRVAVVGRGRHGTFVTSHLESRRENTEIRIRQIQQIQSSVLSERSVCWLGDFNFDVGWPEDAVLTEWTDAWTSAANGPGYTVDTARNAMCLAHKRGERATRYDRVLTRGPLEITSARLLGTEAVDADRRLWPSDHFGVVVDLRHA